MTEKAKVAELSLAEYKISVFDLTGSYGYSYEWLAELIQIDKQILSNKKSPYYLPKLTKGLYSIGKFNQTVSIEGISGTYRYLNSEQLMTALGSLAVIVPEKVLPLLTACAIEGIDRRADKTFDKQRSEEEYNARLKARIEGKQTRWDLTDSIKAYIERIYVQKYNR